MANIVIYNPSGVVVNCVTQYLTSVNTPDYDLEPNKVVDPDLLALVGIPVKYWKVSTSLVVEMSSGEKLTIDSYTAWLNQFGWTVDSAYATQISGAWYRPLDLLIYYGWLNSFNSDVNGWNNEKAAQDLSRYGMLVFGDGLQNPSHGDYANTIIIIPRIKELNPLAKIYGYVACNQSLANFQTKVDQWDSLKVHGIFIDSAGYDYGTVGTNGREAYNAKVDYVHLRMYCKNVFTNAWNMDNVIGLENDPAYPNSTWNPSLVPSKLAENDWYLLESFPINTLAWPGAGGFETASEWLSRGNKASNHRKTYGINLAGVAVISDSHINATGLFNFGFISSAMWSLESFGSSDENFGASSAKTTFRTRPDTEGCGRIYLYKEIPYIRQDPNDTDVYVRYSDYAKFLVDFSSGIQVSGIIKTSFGYPRDIFRRYGTTAPENWYSYLSTGTALTTGAPSINNIRAFPFVVQKQCVLDRIAINVTTLGTSSHYRLGIYSDNGNCYPNSLILDAGVVDTSTTGVKSLSINLTLNPGLYWLVCVGDGTAPTVRCFAVAGLLSNYVLGFDNTLGTTPVFGYTYSFTYGALPATFAAGASRITAVPIPAIFVRLSS